MQSKLSEALRLDLNKLADLANTSKPAQRVELKEGERRIVTILFLDIQGFTAMSERLDPEDVQLIIDQCFKVLTHEIEKYQGFIEKYEGDRMMALFGSREASEEDCEQAIRAALGMKDKFLDINRILHERNIQIGMRIGINTGLVVTGRIGKGRDQDFTVMGDAVNLASRLESNAPSNEIMISEDVVKIAGPVFSYQSLGEIKVKGKAEPIKVFQVEGLNPSRPDRWDRSPFAKRSAYTGRGIERELLHDIWQKAKLSDGRFAAVGIRANAGLGKSRLVHEFKKELQSEIGDATVKHAGASSLVMIPLAFLKELVAKMLHALSITAKDEVVQNEKYLPFWKYLAGQSELDDSRKNLDSDALTLETHLALRTLIQKLSLSYYEAKKCPFILHLDDVQWLDRTSLEALRFAFSTAEACKHVLLLLSYRPEFQVATLLATESHLVKELRLLPLSQEDCMGFIYGSLTGLFLSSEDESFLYQKSGGNPFFMEELVQALIDEKAIVLQDGRYRAVKSFKDVSLPDSIHRVIISRIDKLDSKTKQLLMACSVLGETFPKSVFHTMAKKLGLDKQTAEQILSDLVSMGMLLIVSDRISDDEQVSFRHVVNQQVVYSMILNHNKRILHALAAETFEAQFKERANEEAIFLFDHFSKGRALKPAFKYAFLSLEKMRRTHLPKEGLKLIERVRELNHEAHENVQGDTIAKLLLYEAWFYNHLGQRENESRSLQLLENSSEVKSSPELRSSTQVLKANHLISVGKFLEASEVCLRELSLLKDEIDESSSLLAQALELERYCGVAYFNLSRYAEAQEHYATATKWASALKDINAESAMLNAMGLLKFNQGLAEESITYYNKSFELARSVNNLKSQANVKGNMGLAAWSMGDYTIALDYLAEAYKLFLDLSFIKGQAVVLGNIGVLYHKLGQYDLAIKNYFRALDLRRTISDKSGEGFDLVNLGVAYNHLGVYDKALEYLSEAKKVADLVGSNYLIAEVLNSKSIVYRKLGETDFVKLDEGVEVATEALDLAEKYSLRVAQVKAHTNLARLFYAKGQVDVALSHSMKALVIVEAHDRAMEGAEEEAYVNHYVLLSQQGKAEEAIDCLKKVVQLCIARARKIEDTALRRSFLEDVRQNRYVLAEWKKLHPQWNLQNLENIYS